MHKQRLFRNEPNNSCIKERNAGADETVPPGVVQKEIKHENKKILDKNVGGFNYRFHSRRVAGMPGRAVSALALCGRMGLAPAIYRNDSVVLHASGNITGCHEQKKSGKK